MNNERNENRSRSQGRQGYEGDDRAYQASERDDNRATRSAASSELAAR